MCNHVAALLFKAAHCLDISNPSCTTTACSWKSRSSKTSASVYMKLSDMKFNKPSHQKRKPDSRFMKKKKDSIADGPLEHLITEEDTCEMKQFVETVRNCNPTALIFLPGMFQPL